MSAALLSRGDGGAVATLHLQCPLCGHFSKSHAHLLAHTAAAHPAQLDHMAFGRLGNVLLYQSTARLFHCNDCFYTTKEFTKLYNHVISKHCTDGEKEAEGGAGPEAEGGAGPEAEGGPGPDGEAEGGDGGSEGAEKAEDKTGEEGEEEREQGDKEAEGKKESAAKRKRSSEGEEEEEEEGEANEEDGADQRPDPGKADGEGEDGVLLFDGGGYRCLICGWRNKLKALGINHVVRRHDIPKAYAAHAVKRDAASAAAAATATPKPAHSTAEEEEASSSELLKEEMEATAKVVRFIANRFVCLICGWKTKLKGFAISHVVRSHDVERPYGCKECGRSFFLPSHLQQHVRALHRPGRYACPFCCFRSHFLGGFRRHCSRCNARSQEEGGEGEGEEGPDEDAADAKE
ncbi:chromosome alignment-maintaining phosphoprotein 1-like [Myripristis murdjan]|uniref:chromosome alignment-maintaining phosphoprotein 1-like n=1 Tax=Myripristis murdjan TaxID=586833 RepID=UPI001175EB6C|nr:chromosome alignment-maintaining phosphoprotein 1-like [Myripristis murdjan]